MLNIGQQFGRWTIISGPIQRHVKNGTRIYWTCRCECGTIKSLSTQSLMHENGSCGCGRSEKITRIKTIHGFCGTRLYTIWQQMKDRCYNPKSISYYLYGARGIYVCDDWKDNFESFAKWSIENGYADDLTIDRIDPNGMYCPSNCRWATNLEQQNNKRTNLVITAFGETKSLSQWASDPRCSVCAHSLRYRIAKGWQTEWAITAPAYSFKRE